MENKYTKHFFVESGRDGGKAKSEKKAVASRANGRLGGRPWKSAENIKKRAERMAAARARGTHTGIEWKALLLFCGNKCAKCGAAEKVTRDHIRPIYQGGTDSISNIQPLCPSCNYAKGPSSEDFRPKGWAAGVKKILSDGEKKT